MTDIGEEEEEYVIEPEVDPVPAPEQEPVPDAVPVEVG